jgi:hypothetical protein
MNQPDIDTELEALLWETIEGLRKRISSDDANASDYGTAIKLLDATGTIEAVRDDKTRTERDKEFAATLDDLPAFDETGQPIQ